MPYNKELAERLRALLAAWPDLTEKEMFGGIGFMLRGNLACGVHKDRLIVRVGPKQHEKAMQNPYARVFDITGRPMQGWVMVVEDGWKADDDLEDWVQQGVEFALSLSPK
jgi:TfoX/Sxy family transcriptional regulator of competence genes